MENNKKITPEKIVEIRDTMDMRTGEIIDYMIDNGYADKEKIQDIKNLLLTAQAAERTARLADAMLLGDDKYPLTAFDDSIFKFVGSERDPEGLRYAQANWQSAATFHFLLNSKLYSEKTKEYLTPEEIKEVAKGFKATASYIYYTAAEQIREYSPEIAEYFNAVSASIATELKPEWTPTNQRALRETSSAMGCLVFAICAKDDLDSYDKGFYDTIGRLIDLTSVPQRYVTTGINNNLQDSSSKFQK